MIVPTGYTALDMVGFTDKGAYSSSASYVKNDLAHYSGSIWRCLIDDTTGIIPSEGANWTIFVSEPANSVEGSIAPIEVSPATAAHAQGTQLFYNDVLYKVKTAISIGDTLTVGTNIETADDITSQLAEKAETSSLGTAAGKDSTNAVTENSTDLVESGAVFSVVGALTDLTTTVKTSIVAAINEIVGKITNKVLFYENVACSATTGNFATISNSAITADHVVTEFEFDNPSAISPEWSWTTAAGSLTLNGTCSAATTVTITLTKKDN